MLKFLLFLFFVSLPASANMLPYLTPEQGFVLETTGRAAGYPFIVAVALLNGIVETGCFAFFADQYKWTRRFLGFVFLINVVSNFLFQFVWGAVSVSLWIFMPTRSLFWICVSVWTLVCEAFVVGAEWSIFRRRVKNAQGVFRVTLLANIVSFGTGILALGTGILINYAME